MDDNLKAALNRVSRLCDRGFANSDPTHYDTIRDELAPFASDEGVATMIRLAEGGPTLSSKRFAYPHIQSRARDMLGAPVEREFHP